MTWTQPLCLPCWRARHRDREPHRVPDDETHRCCMCGNVTDAGIYIRADPATIPYPRPDHQDEP